MARKPSLKVNQQRIGLLDVVATGAISGERILVNELVAMGTVPGTIGPLTLRDVTTIVETAAGFGLNAMAGNKDGGMARAGLDVFSAGFSNLGPMLYAIGKSYVTGTARAPGQVFSARAARPRVVRQSAISATPYVRQTSGGQQRVTSYQGIAQQYAGYGGSGSSGYGQFT